ncbi:Aste57867_9354 [Aphanomyces stellatus]|uniref:Aste57867_9354 protein n=1 Tax=Aphanomyces stellatus TaxID=120398 RepID=A0A485KMK8_9STRA|nr:hypothetical protein As57867_009318 [Aphanomyces stellatus]VFT86235.1 Aste57867_9354 [Aphanomyces stellatus]
MPFKQRANDQNKLIVVGISKSLDDAGLSDMFGLYGTVAEAKVVMDQNKQSKGFGFVTYTSAAAKNKAIKHMNQTSVDGRVLNVRDVIPKADRDAAAGIKEEKPKTGVCWAFQKGLCDKGDACKYPHEVKEGDYGSCFEWVQSGKCKRGDECKFAHTGHKGDKKDQGDDDGTAAAPAAENKPRVCYAFQNGKCHRGKACMFLHSQLDIPVATPSEVAADAKKRKRDDDGNRALDPAAKLAALVAAEEKAWKAYEDAKKARQDLEKEINKVNSDDEANVPPPKKEKPAKKQDKVTKDSKVEKGTKEKGAVAKIKSEDKPKPVKTVKTVEEKKVKAESVTKVEPKKATNGDDDDDDDEFTPPVSFAAIDDDDGADIPLSSIIQNAISQMKKDDAEMELVGDEPDVEPVAKANKAKVVKAAAAPKKQRPATKDKPRKVVLVKDHRDADVDMGAAFDDHEPPKKKTKVDPSRPTASDHRRLRQAKKKEALQQLKAKKEIEIDSSKE